MNTKFSILLISSTTFLMGIVLYALHHQWIIIIRRSYATMPSSEQLNTKKNCTLSYWHNNRWHTESQELIWSPQEEENIVTLINNWLSLLDAEQIIPKKVLLQSAALLPSTHEAYLSFDRNPLAKEWSTYRKLMFIEGLLKTLRNNNISCKSIFFLVHHQPLIDPHLDFSCSWPINGFIAP